MPTTRTAHRAHLRALARQVRAARKALSTARLELARATDPNDPPVIVDPTLGRRLTSIRARAEQFVGADGVVGYGIGFVRKRNVDTHSPCLTLYVTRKLPRAALARLGRRALPRSIQIASKRIRVDVVELGRLQRHAFVGQSLSTSVNGTTRFGTIGARAVQAAGGAPVLLTAMHVTGLRMFPSGGATRVSVFVPGGGQQPIGELVAGSMQGIDAAMISVAGLLSEDVPLIGRIRGWRPILLPGDRGTRVRMFGAASQQLMDGVIEEPFVVMPAFNLDGAIVVRGFTSLEGDSGAALVDPENMVLGFLVGRTSSDRRLFCPAGMVLSRLGCDIPTLN